jgi:hypothetical protein
MQQYLIYVCLLQHGECFIICIYTLSQPLQKLKAHTLLGHIACSSRMIFLLADVKSAKTKLAARSSRSKQLAQFCH